MNKDAYYFPHDSNARNDQRLLKVRMKYGMEGYGIYFGIIEILREQSNYKLPMRVFDSIAYDLRVDVKVIKDLVTGHYNLFEYDVDTDEFYSKSLKRRLERMDELKQKRIEAGRKGGIASAKVKQKPSTAKALNNTKLNNTKLNKTKENKIDKRVEKFKKQVFEFSNQYHSDLLNNFFTYWSEPNKSNTKMKYELQQTFDIKRRLSTWDRNSFGSFKRDDNSLDSQLVERSKNSKKEDRKFKEYIKNADAEAIDEIPNLNEWNVAE